MEQSYAERQNGTQRHITGRMRRMVYAFSKKLDHHRAALALGYAWYNLGRVVRTLRITPAMQCSVANHIWTLDEFLDACLAEPAGEKPVRRSLAHRTPEVPARELPNGRGFLRVISGGKGALPSPAPLPPSPVTPAVAAPVTQPDGPAADEQQLDLLAWRPKPPPKGQLSLFGPDFDPEPLK